MRNDYLMPNADPAQADEQESEVGSSPPSSVHSEVEGHEDVDRASTASPASFGEPGEARMEAPDWEENPREVWCWTGQRHPLGTELQGEWMRTERPESVWLDGFVPNVTAACLENSKVPRTTRTRGATKLKARASEKRRRFADTQEMFKRCPAHLGDLVRRNDL